MKVLKFKLCKGFKVDKLQLKEYIHSTTTTPGMTDNQVSSSRDPRRQHVTVINGPGWYGVQRVTCTCITVAGEGIKSFVFFVCYSQSFLIWFFD